jgi:hypothetical protein
MLFYKKVIMNISNPSYKRNSVLIAAALFFLISFILYFITQPAVPDPFNYFIYLADALLNGRLHLLDTPFYFEELIIEDGLSYTIYPPMPALLLAPFVALWGLSFSQVFASIVLGSVNVSLVFLLMRRLTESFQKQIWMTLLFGFGTIHWYTSTIGSVWYFAHIVSLFFLLFAIIETFGQRRVFLIGLLLGASYWSRIPTVLTLPFFIVMLSDLWLPVSHTESPLKRIKLRPLLLLALGVGVFVLLNFLYNYLRFGSPFDVAYSMHTVSEAKAKVSPWFDQGLFSLSYMRHHLYTFLLQPPAFIETWPYIVPSKAGLSILITTPAFIFALAAGIRNRLALACWLAVIPPALLIFSKSGTGWTQFGYRYALDFYPFLLLLTFKGIPQELKWYHKLLIILGILVNLWGVLFINRLELYELY